MKKIIFVTILASNLCIASDKNSDHSTDSDGRRTPPSENSSIDTTITKSKNQRPRSWQTRRKPTTAHQEIPDRPVCC